MSTRTYSNIPMLPRVTAEILRLADDPACTVIELKRVILHDPGLSCRIMRVVNSSFYGLSGQIGSLERASPILGLRVIRTIAIIASMEKFFHVGRSDEVFRSIADDLWRHSVSTAAAARILADRLKLGHPDEFFLSGLIHDIGIIAELYLDRSRLLDAFSLTCPDIHGVPQRSLCEIERHLFGDDHQTIGREMCEQWKFPKFLCHVTGFHHSPLELPRDDWQRPCVIAAADCVASSLEGAFRLDLTSLQVQPDVLSVLELSGTDLQEVREEVSLRADEIDSMFA